MVINFITWYYHTNVKMKSLSPTLYCSHKYVLERSFMGTCIHFGKHEINVL